jgi:hypothetical protein
MPNVWSPLSRWAIARAVDTIKPDIVQTYMGRATRLTHVPIGKGTVHIARLGGYYGLHAFRHAHAWVANTQGLCDYLIQGGMPAGRVFHIANFVDAANPVPDSDLFTLRQSLRIPEDALILLAAGRFIGWKGHAYLLEAFAHLPIELRGRRSWLVMVGDGPLRDRLKGQARQLGIANRIAWAGWQAHTGPFYQMAHVVVFPSQEQEPLGNVILEAWAWHKPLVATAFPGALELTSHGADVWRVPCRDPVALATGIRRVLEDEELALKLAVAGHARVQRDFSRAAVVDRYLELYRSLLGSI